jgi:hypothetical protein
MSPGRPAQLYDKRESCETWDQNADRGLGGTRGWHSAPVQTGIMMLSDSGSAEKSTSQDSLYELFQLGEWHIDRLKFCL